ncbi:General stress protein 18 [Rubripirellula obstinata]|uniref:General stress protein 18 n=1 Tax=Rubripirellula obstinata TaxID=406547 RepID=A0A5B1CMX2_9BACT|nr:type 1 glutamine amidotransferase domain-containing protein [Rubripirellula obstinata]KAA1261712.1 General stress protein 18 [Rubripirellula obstinata]
MSRQNESQDAIALAQSTAATPLVPSLNTDLLLSYPDDANRDLLAFLQRDENQNLLQGKRIAIVSTDGVEEIELTIPLRKLREMGAVVEVVAPESSDIGSLGIVMPALRQSHIMTIRFIEPAGWHPVDVWINDADPSNYDAVIIPGGAWNPDLLRGDPRVIKFIQTMQQDGKLVSAICHGPQVLISAGVVAGKKATSWPLMLVDLENAGVKLVDAPVVIDDNLITSRGPLDLPHFVDAIANFLSENA